MDVCVPELISVEDYDFNLAKTEASLSWLLAKAGINWKSESGICEDECSSLLTPSVMNGLTSGLFYCKAMCSIFPKDKQFFDQSHLSVVRWLLRQGFEVLPDEIDFELLKRKDPFKRDMHLVLIDKIMAAFIYQTLSIENVVKAVRRFSTFSASSELPTTIEGTILFWSNKVCQSMCDKYRTFLMPEFDSHSKDEANNSFYDLLQVSELEDFAFGRSLACLLSFYKPDKMVFEDICLDENSGIADSLYNLQLCAEVCSQICESPTSTSQKKILHMTITDVFYSHVHLTVNLMSMFADLFECFELKSYSGNNKESIQASCKESNAIKIPKISNATKRSLYGTLDDDNDSMTSTSVNNSSNNNNSSKTSTLLPFRRDGNQIEGDSGESQTEFEKCTCTKMTSINEVHESLNQDGIRVTARDTSSVSSSSCEAIVNHYLNFQCSPPREAFIHRKDSDDSTRTQDSKEGYTYRVKSPPFFLPFDSKPFSTPSAKSTNYEEDVRSKSSTCDHRHDNRHIKYCHDLGLISRYSKFRKPNGSANKFTSESLINDRDARMYNVTSDDADDEVSAITGANNNEEFATPPEDFDGHLDEFYFEKGFNNSNSVGPKKKGSGITGSNQRIEYMEARHDPGSQSLKTSWQKQKKPHMKDETANNASTSRKDPQRCGTFRIARGHKDADFSAGKEKARDLFNSSHAASSLIPKQSEANCPNKMRGSSSSILHWRTTTTAGTTPQSNQNLTNGKTTWIQSLSSASANTKINESLDVIDNNILKDAPSKMALLKMELSEKRKQIEGKKLSLEMLWSKQRQQVRNEAFLQIAKRNHKTENKKMEKVVESESSKDFALTQKQAFEKPTVISKSEKKISEIGNPGIANINSNSSDQPSSKLMNVCSKTSLPEINQNSDDEENAKAAFGFDNNVEAARTIDHLTHSLSELKGEVKRLSMEQDQLKGFVAVSQGSSTNKSGIKKPRTAQANEKDIASQFPKSKLHPNQIRSTEGVNYSSIYTKPHPENDISYQKAVIPEVISAATKSFSYQQVPSYAYSPQVIPGNGPFGVGELGYACTTPAYSPYVTLPHKRTNRPLSSDSRFMQIPECSFPPNQLSYEYPSEMIGPYRHPMMNMPHYASPLGQPHPGYHFPVGEAAMNLNDVRHHSSSIAFTIPNDPLNVNNALPEWSTPSHQIKYSTNYAPEDKIVLNRRVVPAPLSVSSSPLPSQTQNLGELNCNPNLQSHPQNLNKVNCNPHVQSSQFFPANIVGTNILDGNHYGEPVSSVSNEKTQQEILKNNFHEKGFISLDGKVDILDDEINRNQFQIERLVMENKNICYSNKSDNNAHLLSSIKGTEEMLVDEETKAEEFEMTGLDNVNKKDNPVAFVVSHTEKEIDDVERRNQKLEELQTRRREEQERKREKLERDIRMKNELQRQRSELSKQKKAEDRARREAIYQSHLQKKLEGFGDEEVATKAEQSTVPRAVASQPVLGSATKRQKSARSARQVEDKFADQPVVRANPSTNSQDLHSPTTKASSTSCASSERMTNGDGDSLPEKENIKEYTGPKLFAKPSHKSNKNIIENAISHCSLAGVVNQETKSKVLEALKCSESKHFVVLFRDVGMQYRGLYTHDLEADTIIKIHGVGPKTISNKHIEKFFKYNCGSKKFIEVASTKHLSATIDGVILFSSLWQKPKDAALAGSKWNLT